MNDETHGFDTVFQISGERFLRVLERLIVDEVPQLLDSLNFSVPVSGGIVQSGVLSLPVAPRASINYRTPADGESFTLVLKFPEAVLSLNDVLNTNLALPPILRGLAPTSVGELTFDLPLKISTDTNDAGTRSPIQLAPGVEEDFDLTNILTAPLNGIIAIPAGRNLESWVQAISQSVKASMINRFKAFLPRIINIDLPAAQLCDLRLRELQLKLLPGRGTNEDSLAFFTRLREDTTGQPGQFRQSNLMQGQQGSLIVSNRLLIKLLCCTFPRSRLVSGLPLEHEEAADGLSCTWRNVRNVTLEGTKYDLLKRLTIGWEDDLLVISGEMRDEYNWCVDLDISFNVKVKFSLSAAGTITSEAFDPEPIDVAADVSNWCIIILAGITILVVAAIGALAGALIGGLLGAAGWGAFSGAVIGGVSGYIFYRLIKRMLSSSAVTAVQDTVGDLLGAQASVVENFHILPPDLDETFGTLDLLSELVVDDFSVKGNIAFRDIGPPVSESEDQLLRPGEMINLDNGRVYPLGAERVEGDADLTWSRAQPVFGTAMYILPGGIADLPGLYTSMELSDRNAARMAVLENVSYLSLTRADLEGLSYRVNTNTSIPQNRIPIPSPRCAILDSTPATSLSTLRVMRMSAGSGPSDGAETYRTALRARLSSCQPFVFGVRTTEGRYARCQAWRDAASNLHLKYTTFNTQLPIEFKKSLRYVKGSTSEPVSGPLGGAILEVPVSWRGRIEAIAPYLRRPFQNFQWQWEGIDISGSGILPGTETVYWVFNNDIIIRTKMGEHLAGRFFVTIKDASGMEVSKSLEMNLASHVAVFDTNTLGLRQVPPEAGDDLTPPAAGTTGIPLKQQLQLAFAEKLEIDPEKIAF
jgi:hypothetical protein